MNAPFKPDDDQSGAKLRVTISELKKNPAAVIARAQKRQVAVVNRGKPVAYVISPQVWEYLCDVYEDMKDGELVRQILEEDGDEGIKVTLEELRAGFPEEGEEAVEEAGVPGPPPV